MVACSVVLHGSMQPMQYDEVYCSAVQCAQCCFKKEVKKYSCLVVNDIFTIAICIVPCSVVLQGAVQCNEVYCCMVHCSWPIAA
jgi:hypothetical protein